MSLRGMLRTGLIVLAAVGSLATTAACDAGRKDDPVVNVEATDATMNAAIAEARAALPRFWALYEGDPVVNATAGLKVGFPVKGGGHEHMWLNTIKREGAVITGVLGNDPAFIPSMKLGDVVTIDPALISDWSYERNGRLYGSYTTRVLVGQMSAEEAAPYRKMLSDKPLEDGRP